MAFKKDDTKKIDPTLVPMKQILKIAEVLGYGAKKYGRNNWKKATCKDQDRYKAALARHLFAYLDGELIDSESGLSHLAHMATNTVFLMHFSDSMVDLEVDLEEDVLVDLALKSIETKLDVNTLIGKAIDAAIEQEEDKVEPKYEIYSIWDETLVFVGDCLRDANLYGADLGGVDLSGADLRDANLGHTHLSGVDLSGADLRDANLSGANLCSANLCSANLCSAKLSGVNLRYADLSGANLSEVDLEGVDLRDAYTNKDTILPLGYVKYDNQIKENKDND